MKYCLDANFFIYLWRTHYSPDIARPFWDWLANLSKKGILLVPDEVFEEIAVGDGLHVWLNSIKQYVLLSLNEKVQDELTEVLKYPNAICLADSNKKHGADIFVVAYAKTYGAIVVSDDTGIHRLCKDCNVAFRKSHEFVKEQKLKLTVVE